MSAASSLVIAPVASDADLEAFIRLPWAIYRDDPNWVPPLRGMQRDALRRDKGAFFEIGDAEYFLARRGGRVVGRISAHVNRLYEQYHDANTGFFGWFVCENDRQAAHALFEAAAAWVRSQGKTRLHGPLSFGIYDDEVGLLVEGFDTPPCMMHAHNPRYYEDLVLSWGFAKTFDWYAYKMMSDRYKGKIEPLKKQLELILARNNSQIIHLKRSEFPSRVDEVKELFNDIWSKNWGHVPLTDRQFTDIFVTLQPLLRKDLQNFIMEDGKIVAFSVVAPDMNLSVKKFDGKFGLWQKLRLLWDCRIKPLTAARAVIMGVARSHQWKRLHHAIILQIIINFIENYPKLEYCDCSLIPESLIQWNKTLINYGAIRYKVFRLYDRDI